MVHLIFVADLDSSHYVFVIDVDFIWPFGRSVRDRSAFGSGGQVFFLTSQASPYEAGGTRLRLNPLLIAITTEYTGYR